VKSHTYFHWICLIGFDEMLLLLFLLYWYTGITGILVYSYIKYPFAMYVFRPPQHCTCHDYVLFTCACFRLAYVHEFLFTHGLSFVDVFCCEGIDDAYHFKKIADDAAYSCCCCCIGLVPKSSTALLSSGENKLIIWVFVNVLSTECCVKDCCGRLTVNVKSMTPTRIGARRMRCECYS